MNTLGYLVTCLCVLLPAGYALQCHQCESFKQSDCAHNGPLSKVIPCSQSTYSAPQFCFYKETYDTKLQATKISSGCGVSTQSGAGIIDWQSIADQQCQVASHLQARDCRICLADLCNTQYDANSPTNSHTYRGKNVAPSASSKFTGSVLFASLTLFLSLIIVL